ncbi:MAG: hypothetical protein AB8E15_12430 [Bdellovibrionales bacterium]
MYSIKLFFIAMFLGFSVVADDGYSYFIEDPYKATFISSITGVISNGDINSKVMKIPTLISERKKLPFIGRRVNTYVNVSIQKNQKKAPLMIVLGGLGSSATSGTSKHYQSIAYKLGMHSIGVSSPFFWRYNTSESGHATPGYFERDRAEFYEYLIRVTKRVAKKRGVQFSEINLVGYSMGALQAVFLSELDDEKQSFNFQKIVLVNPPIDLYESTSKLDALLATWQNLSSAEKNLNKQKLLREGYLAIKKHDKGVSLKQIIDEIELSTSEFKETIGMSFLETLENLVLTTELVNRRGTIELYPDHYSPQPALDQARQFTFIRYFNEILFPEISIYAKSNDKDYLVSKMGLLLKGDYIRSNDRIRIQHNSDDIIISASDIGWIESSFPANRRVIYPRGGHLGNVWFPTNVADFIRLITQP